jgi:hypothetical protein
MSHSSSVGTGTPQDDNENHPRPDDHWPSRTMGADASPGQELPPVELVEPLITAVPAVPGQSASASTAITPAPQAPPSTRLV